MLKTEIDNCEAIIFDMDGTLIDSMWLWKQVDIDFFNMFDLEFDEDLQKNIEGMSFHQTAQYMKERYNFPINIEEMIDIWNKKAYEYYSKIVNFKTGAKEFLTLCVEKNIKLGIATSNSRFLFDAVRNRLNLDKYFDCMLTGSEIKNGKPAPDVYLTVAQKLDVPPHRCLVFEDIIPGIKAGQNAGMKVCAVADEYSVAEETDKKALADFFIKDFSDILKMYNK